MTTVFFTPLSTIRGINFKYFSAVNQTNAIALFLIIEHDDLH